MVSFGCLKDPQIHTMVQGGRHLKDPLVPAPHDVKTCLCFQTTVEIHLLSVPSQLDGDVLIASGFSSLPTK